ncbi:MAG TPA: hypothetical protein VL572_11500 [Pyrinomonadaceae bacterium]|nr:hypothetical protein [Pyrinomonadaceae bacterium]
MKEDQSKRYEACFELYKKYAGRQLSQIEREMRALGFADFHRRILYSRTENGTYKPAGSRNLAGGNKFLRLRHPMCGKACLSELSKKFAEATGKLVGLTGKA